MGEQHQAPRAGHPFWPSPAGRAAAAGATTAARSPWRRLDRRALLAALLYAGFGAAWILWSDQVLFGLTADVDTLRALGEWKGLVFVALSAVWVAAVGWRRRRALAQWRQLGSRRLLGLLMLAAAVIVSAGIGGAIRASRGERQEVSELLRIVAASRAEQWSAWVQERQRDTDARRDLVAPLVQALRREPEDAAGRLLAPQLQALCRALGCLEARIDELPAGRLPLRGALSFSGDAVASGTPQRVQLELLSPLPPGADRTPQALVLRFDATPVIARLLSRDGAALDGMQLLLTRRLRFGWHWLEADPAGGLVGRLVAADEARGWPDLAEDAGGAARGFDAVHGPDAAYVGAALPLDSGWTLAAFVDTQRLYQRAWGDLVWIAAADTAALLLAAAGVFGLQQRRALRAARRERAGQQDRLRALELLDAISSSTADLIFTKDLEGRFTFVNAAVCRALQRPAAEVLGRRVDEFLSADDSARIATLEQEVLSRGEVIDREGELTAPQGRRHCFLYTFGPLRGSDGSISGSFGIMRDVTQRRRQQERQRQWAKAFESTRDGVIICDAQGQILSVNPAFTEITGYAADEATGQTPALLHSGYHDKDFYRGLWAALTDSGHWRGEIWNRRKNGEVYPEWLTIDAVRDDRGALTHYVGVFTDISRVKRDEAELQRLANYDPLTELPNRRLLGNRLEQALARSLRQGGRTALLALDLDGFKTVNDSLGHPAGDELLVAVARRLKARVRASDTLARLGGDEFVVIAESLTDAEQAAVLAQDLLAAVARPLTLTGGHEVYVTASIGISLFPDDGSSDATSMMRDADAALYRAKAQGRNCLCFYTQDLNRQAVARLETEVALSQALQRGELLLHYQPKFSADGARITGAEALLRWRRGGELVPPGQFIPIAEQSSLILDIGAWVIDAACAQLAQWRDRGLALPRIAVNVAARQFAAGDLDRVVAAALRRHGVDAAGLELEVTESMLIDEPEAGIAMLRRLKELGVALSLDDFGTGYSSLAYLRQFPIDRLKIDKSFVDHIDRAPDGSAIVDAVIALAHRLGLTVVAEGVETATQQAHLRAQGCDELQGYGLARPMPVEALEALCAARATGAG